MNQKELVDLYTEYLIASPGKTTATGLSILTDNLVSHDKITRLLASGKINSKTLWENVKPMCHEIRSEDAVLIFDDSIEEKMYTRSNDLINWHFDHTVNRKVKGVNFLSAVYHSNDVSLPIAVEYVHKTIPSINKKGKIVKKSARSKNEMYRDILRQASYNIEFKYALNDTWFTNAANMNCVVYECYRHFIMEIMGNRKVALSQKDKHEGKYVSIKTLELEARTMSVYLEKVDFPILLSKQVFKNKDGSTGARYLVSSDLSLTYKQITTIYKKRWKVEEYHQSIKSLTSFAKSPTQTVTTQTSHFTASIMAFVKLELLKIRRDMNHHALKRWLLLKALRASSDELKKLLTPGYVLV